MVPFLSVIEVSHSSFYSTVSPSRTELSQSRKTVVITGCDSGIGLPIFQSFALARASKIAIIGRRRGVLEKAAASIHTPGSLPKIQQNLRTHSGLRSHCCMWWISTQVKWLRRKWQTNWWKEWPTFLMVGHSILSNDGCLAKTSWPRGNFRRLGCKPEAKFLKRKCLGEIGMQYAEPWLHMKWTEILLGWAEK